MMENDDTTVSGALAGAEALSDVMADLEARSQRFGTARIEALSSPLPAGVRAGSIMHTSWKWISISEGCRRRRNRQCFPARTGLP